MLVKQKVKIKTTIVTDKKPYLHCQTCEVLHTCMCALYDCLQFEAMLLILLGEL